MHVTLEMRRPGETTWEMVGNFSASKDELSDLRELLEGRGGCVRGEGWSRISLLRRTTNHPRRRLPGSASNFAKNIDPLHQENDANHGGAMSRSSQYWLRAKSLRANGSVRAAIGLFTLISVAHAQHRAGSHPLSAFDLGRFKSGDSALLRFCGRQHIAFRTAPSGTP